MDWLVIFIAFAVVYLLVDSGIRNNHQIKNLIALILTLVVAWQIPNLISKNVDVTANIILTMIAVAFFFVIAIKSEGYLDSKEKLRGYGQKEERWWRLKLWWFGSRV